MERNSVAYIDGANLHKGIKELGWILDYAAFRVWLTEKYHVRQAYLFLGYLKWQSDLYDSLKACGYSILFKEIT